MSELSEALWICAECVQQRCYRFPSVGHVASRVCTCSYCGAYGPAWDIDDLLPGWEDDVSEV